MATYKNNRERTMQDYAEEALKRFGLGLELPDELKTPETAPEYAEFSWNEPSSEPSMLAAYKKRRGIKEEPKKLLKDMGDFVAPGVRSGEIIERLIPQIESLKKNGEDLAERLDAFEAKTSDCTNRNCRAFRTLHVHEGGI